MKYSVFARLEAENNSESLPALDHEVGELLNALAETEVANWNPLEVDPAYRDRFFERLAKKEVRDLHDLTAADSLLELMHAPDLRRSDAYKNLRKSAAAFINRYPQLLQMGWPQDVGSMHELMEELSFEAPQAQQVLSKFRLATTS